MVPLRPEKSDEVKAVNIQKLVVFNNGTLFKKISFVLVYKN